MAGNYTEGCENVTLQWKILQLCLPSIPSTFFPRGLLFFRAEEGRYSYETLVYIYQISRTYIYMYIYIYIYGPGSSVGMATELRAGRSGIESRWGRDFPPAQTGPEAHPVSCKMGTGSFPGVKCGRGVLLTSHSLPVPRSWKSRVIPLPTLWATPGL